MNHLSWHTSILWPIYNITDSKQSNMATEEEQSQPEAEQQGSPEEQSMETSSGADGSHDQEKEEKEKRKEAKVCPIFTNPTYNILNLCFIVMPLYL